jgi:hypothetical protein
MQWFATHKKQHPDDQGGQNAEKIKKREKSVNAIK